MKKAVFLALFLPMIALAQESQTDTKQPDYVVDQTVTIHEEIQEAVEDTPQDTQDENFQALQEDANKDIEAVSKGDETTIDEGTKQAQELAQKADETVDEAQDELQENVEENVEKNVEETEKNAQIPNLEPNEVALANALSCKHPIVIYNFENNKLSTKVVNKVFRIMAKSVCKDKQDFSYNLELWDLKANAPLKGATSGQNLDYRLNSGIYPNQNTLKNGEARGVIRVLKPFEELAFKITVGDETYFSDSFSVREESIALTTPKEESYDLNKSYRFFTQKEHKNLKLDLTEVNSTDVEFVALENFFDISFLKDGQKDIVVFDKTQFSDECSKQMAQNECKDIDSLCSCYASVNLSATAQAKPIIKELVATNFKIQNKSQSRFSFYGDEENKAVISFDINVPSSDSELSFMVKNNFKNKNLKTNGDEFNKEFKIATDKDTQSLHIEFSFGFDRTSKKPIEPIAFNADTFTVIVSDKKTGKKITLTDLDLSLKGFVYGLLYPQDVQTSLNGKEVVVDITYQAYGNKSVLADILAKDDLIRGFSKNWWLVDSTKSLKDYMIKRADGVPTELLSLQTVNDRQTKIDKLTFAPSTKAGLVRYDIDLSGLEYLFYDNRMKEPLTLFLIKTK